MTKHMLGIFILLPLKSYNIDQKCNFCIIATRSFSPTPHKFVDPYIVWELMPCVILPSIITDICTQNIIDFSECI